MSILESSFFDTRPVILFHIIQLILIIAIVVITVYRMTMPVPFTRGQIMALSMGGKGIIVIQYQILTQSVKSLRRFINYKLFAIFNVMEVIGWGVATGFQFQGITQVCTGTSCTFQWVEVALSIVVFIIAQQPAFSTTLDFLHRRKQNTELAQEPMLLSGRRNRAYVSAGGEMGNSRDTSPYNPVYQNDSAYHTTHGQAHQAHQNANAYLSGQGQVYHKP